MNDSHKKRITILKKIQQDEENERQRKTQEIQNNIKTKQQIIHNMRRSIKHVIETINACEHASIPIYNPDNKIIVTRRNGKTRLAVTTTHACKNKNGEVIRAYNNRLEIDTNGKCHYYHIDTNGGTHGIKLKILFIYPAAIFLTTSKDTFEHDAIENLNKFINEYSKFEKDLYNRIEEELIAKGYL